MQSYSQRAPFNDWWYWSECLVKRFRTISEIYNENGEVIRGQEAAEWARKLKDNCAAVVNAIRKGMKTDEEKAKIRELEEEAIFKAAAMLRELLVNFPFISSSMQDFLFVNWEDCKWDDTGEQQEEIDEETGLPIKKRKKRGTRDTRVIELFWGPKARQDEGIRSGKHEDGGIPGILYNLLLAERTSSSRAPTEFGKMMQISATQQNVATNKNDAMKNMMQFKPSGSI
ncbi:MAG: hypothetical protein GC131_03895 [Alphaproteobacteria bacterium]|nr:hypothetical protein [Alphaproteobacteria bacterium]